MTQPLFFGNALASGSSFNVKRKMGDGDSDDEGGNQVSKGAYTPRGIPSLYNAHAKPSQARSPPFKRRATFERPTPLPELMTDYSNSASNSDEDVAMDQDGDADMDRMDSPARAQQLDDRGFVPHYDYEYGMSGSGGIGFGPGAEEDGEMMEELMAESESRVQLLGRRLTRRSIQHIPELHAPLQPQPLFQRPAIHVQHEHAVQRRTGNLAAQRSALFHVASRPCWCLPAHIGRSGCVGRVRRREGPSGPWSAVQVDPKAADLALPRSDDR